MKYTSDDWVANYYETQAIENELILVEDFIDQMREDVASWADSDLAPMSYKEPLTDADGWKTILKQECINLDEELGVSTKTDDLNEGVDEIVKMLVTYRSYRVMRDYLCEQLNKKNARAEEIEDYLMMMDVIFEPDELWELVDDVR